MKKKKQSNAVVDFILGFIASIIWSILILLPVAAIAVMWVLWVCGLVWLWQSIVVTACLIYAIACFCVAEMFRGE